MFISDNISNPIAFIAVVALVLLVMGLFIGSTFDDADHGTGFDYSCAGAWY